MTPEELIAQALKARESAWCPYSSYPVGAALLGRSGRVYTGCNVENASFGLTLCAERNAATAGVLAGERDFEALAVVTRDGATMCGACRQFLVEFGADLVVYHSDEAGKYSTITLERLLPGHFGPDSVSP